jgi:predicted nucleic acid-binding protein
VEEQEAEYIDRKFDLMLDRISKLCRKYIVNDSEFELNIAYKLKSNLISKWDELLLLAGQPLNEQTQIAKRLEYQAMYHFFDEIFPRANLTFECFFVFVCKLLNKMAAAQ